MTQNIALSKGSIAIEPFFDATQEMLSGAAINFRLVPISNTAIRAVAGTQDDQASVSIDGSYRFRTTNVDAAHPGGAGGTYDVYVTGTPNDFTGPDPNIDLTDYNFGLTIRAAGSPPTTPLWRKVGEVGWDGTKITRLRRVRDELDTSHLIAPIPSFVPESIQGATGQTAHLTDWLNDAGTVLAYVGADGSASFSGNVVFSGADGLTLSGAGGKDALALTSTAPDTGITFGGDTTLYRPAANTLTTDDQFQIKGSAPTDVALWVGSGATPSLVAQADGKLIWGEGASAPTLYRDGNAMHFTGSGGLIVDQGVSIGGSLAHTGGAVGFFGATPGGRNTGWGAFTRSDNTAAVSRKTLPQTYTTDMLVDVLWTMKEAMVAHGLWGP
jgi:hypothetical protein